MKTKTQKSAKIFKNVADLKKELTKLKQTDLKIVLTQGVWDILHIGHMRYIKKAKQYGDVLIVAVDSDKLVKERKGPDRPVVGQKERLEMISHIKYVDYVILKEDSDHVNFVKNIRPNVLIVSNGTEKDTEKYLRTVRRMHAGNCDEIINLEPQATTSTTARIRTLTLHGAKKLSDEITRVISNYLKQF